MAYQKVFKRHELKFIVTKEQKAKILRARNASAGRRSGISTLIRMTTYSQGTQ